MSDTARSRKMCINKHIEGHHHHLWTLCKGKMWAEWIILNSSHSIVNICARGLKGPIVLFSETSFIIFIGHFFPILLILNSWLLQYSWFPLKDKSARNTVPQGHPKTASRLYRSPGEVLPPQTTSSFCPKVSASSLPLSSTPYHPACPLP